MHIPGFHGVWSPFFLLAQVAACSLSVSAAERLSSVVSVAMGVGICLFILMVVAAWFAVEALQGWGRVSAFGTSCCCCCSCGCCRCSCCASLFILEPLLLLFSRLGLMAVSLRYVK